MKNQFSVEIPGTNGSWSIGYNPFGSGIALLVNRGINCEDHTHVLTKHITNSPKESTIKKCMEMYGDKFKKAIHHFIEFVDNLPRQFRPVYDKEKKERIYHAEVNWGSKEKYAILFMEDLLKAIKDRCEQIEDFPDSRILNLKNP